MNDSRNKQEAQFVTNTDMRFYCIQITAALVNGSPEL